MTEKMLEGQKLAEATRLAHVARGQVMPQLGKATVNPAVHRGSTLLSPTVEEHEAAATPQAVRANHHNGYGTGGTDTHRALETLVADLEGAEHCVLFPSGLAAITTPLMAFCKSGDHLLITDNAYSPARRFAERVLAGLGVQTTFYPPDTSAEALEALIQPNTSCILLEAPGSLTFEMSDLRGHAEVARRHGVTSLVDATWASPLYIKPMALGVDISIHAATKYMGGHSDLLMGTVSGSGEAIWKVREMHFLLGHNTGPDDVSLVLRGLRSLAVRMPRHQHSALTLAHGLERREEVARVLHPGLPSHPGHALWQRDFLGASGLFAFQLKPEYSLAQGMAFCNSLQLFGHGDSWGGYESLAMTREGFSRTATAWPSAPAFSGPLIRLHIGLEDVNDLRIDLERGFAALRTP